jgi:hypothetical protein
MSTEQNQPEPQSAPESAAPVQSGEGASDTRSDDNQGQRAGRFRRRRRRRKPGAPPAAAGQPANGAVTIAASAEAAPSADVQPEADRAQRPASSQPQNQNQNQNQAADGRRRRKKKGGRKFTSGGQQSAGGQPGNRQQTHQPGNTFGGGAGRRQKKGRGPRAFVGPMDHSYRSTNGNYAEAPPSTIQVNGNNGGGRSHQRNNAMNDTGHQSQFLPTYYEPKPPAIAEDAPVKVYCFIEDLFVTAKITEAARKLGVKIAFVKGEKEDLATICEAPEEARAHLILFDLNNVNAKPMTVIPKIRTKLKKSVSIVGFLSHLQGDLKAKGLEAGCDSVMPRAAFSQALPGLLRRYGLEEDVESQDSQHAYF